MAKAKKVLSNGEQSPHPPQPEPKDSGEVKDSLPSAQRQKNAEFEKKKQTFIVRAIWTIIMIASFVAVVLAGHLYIAYVIAVLQILSYREVINITGDPRHFDVIPWGRTLSWYFLVVVMFYQKGESLFGFLRNVGIVESIINPVVQYHRFLAYALYIVGFVFFVGTLRKGHLREQYAQFCVTHIALFLVVVQGHFIEVNVLHGIFWFLIPVSLVIVNDICAYLCGITMGKTPLIQISPKKTVEGFVGAWICTIVFSVIVTHFSASSYYMICPMDELGVSYFSNHTCVPNPVFVPVDWHPLAWLPDFGSGWNSEWTLTFPSVYLHSIVLATFASLIAPFGGFFASGTKRAFKVKDFGDTIPGHGGIVDRFDCQFVMGFFSYVYYETFIALPSSPDLRTVLDAALSLSAQDQKLLLDDLLRVTSGAVEAARVAVNAHSH